MQKWKRFFKKIFGCLLSQHFHQLRQKRLKFDAVPMGGGVHRILNAPAGEIRGDFRRIQPVFPLHQRSREDGGEDITGSVAALPYPFVTVFLLHRSFPQNDADAAFCKINAGEDGAGMMQSIQQMVDLIYVMIFLIW